MSTKENGKKVRKPTFDVYVGHLPKVIKQDRLKRIFSRYGEILDIFCRHGNGPLGYAIIKFRDKKDADRVLREVDKVFVNGYVMEVKNGVKNNQSVENEDGAHGKTVTFSEPVSYFPLQGGNTMDNNLKIKDCKYMPCGQNEMNGQQMQVVEIICTNVDSAVTFHGCSVYRFEELQNISLKLNSICPNLSRVNRKPLLKRVYGALYEDYRWYRCVVRQAGVPSKSGVCIVEYIDYGNIAEVFYTSMVDLPEPLQKISPFAVKCVLSNLMCSPDCHSDVSYLHHLVNKRMTLSAVLSSYSPFGVPEYHVYKCSSNGIDVVNELVRNGYAVYRSQVSSKSPPLQNPESPSCSKSQENNKPKKTNTNKVLLKKAKESSGVEKHAKEMNNSSLEDSVKSPKSSSLDDSPQPENFVPKRIIKRGSDITDVAPVPVLEGSKSVNHLLKVDCVLANLKLVNNIRNLISFPPDDSLIDNAVELLITEVSDNVSQEQISLLENANKKYNEALINIKDCTDENLLPELKEIRNHKKNELLDALKDFLEKIDCSLLAKRKKIQELITALESNSNAWMNVCLSSLPDTIEELLSEYHKERESRWNNIQKARDNTNEKHQKFMDFLGDFQKEFSLNMLNGNSSTSNHLDKSGGKRGSYALKFEEALSDLGIALEEEMKTCSVTKGRSYFPVIKCVLERLDVPKERIDIECELYDKYKSLYDGLNSTSDLSSLFEELSSVRKRIQILALDCEEKEDKILPKLAELHNDLLQEDKLLAKLAKVSAAHFPEVVFDHPELNLREYQSNLYMFKSTWKRSYFPVFETCSRIESSYVSKLCEDFIVIKEFDVSSESEKTALIKKAIVWNEIKSKSLVNIKALFDKKEGVYAVFSEVWDTLYDKPLAIPVDGKVGCAMLQQILKGLFDIHERGMAHGAVHPLAVLHKDGRVVLDFNQDNKVPLDHLCLNGINFQDPSGKDLYKSTDMYAFGCLSLWILFHNLSFTSDGKGVPNILAFQSIIKEVLSDNDFTDLTNLLSPNHCLRPTSKDLYKKGFLKDLRIMMK